MEPEKAKGMSSSPRSGELKPGISLQQPIIQQVQSESPYFQSSGSIEVERSRAQGQINHKKFSKVGESKTASESKKPQLQSNSRQVMSPGGSPVLAASASHHVLSLQQQPVGRPSPIIPQTVQSNLAKASKRANRNHSTVNTKSSQKKGSVSVRSNRSDLHDSESAHTQK